MREIKTLADLGAAARQAGSPIRARLLEGLEASSGLHAASLERLVDLWAASLHATALERCLERGSGGQPWRPVGTVAVVAPGNLCVASWQAIVEPLLAGNRVRVRPGAGDPLAPDNFRLALGMLDEQLAARVEVRRFAREDAAGWHALLEGANCLAIHGSDAGLAGVLQRAGEAGFAGRLRLHGHRASIAVTDAAALCGPGSEDLARSLAHDALLADGRGCMSLRAVVVLGPRDLAAHVHRNLASAMAEVAIELPSGRLAADWLAARHLEVEALALHAALRPDVARVTEGPGWALATLTQPDAAEFGFGQGRLGPGARTLVAHVVEDAAALRRHLAPWRGRLSTVAVTGLPMEVREILDDLAVPRLCPPGRMQAPPTDRSPDGYRPLDGMLVLLDR